MSGSNVAMQVALIKQETLILSGSFQIGFRGQKTADIDVQSPNLAIVQSELQKLPGLTSVNVARAQLGNSVQWDVTFLSLDAAIATPALMTADPQKLVGTGAIANVQSRRSGGRSEAQSLSIYRSLLAPTASFNVVWNGKRSTSLASSSMLAGELKVVLDTIPGLGAAKVERYPSAVGVGFTWLILLTEGTRATPLPLSIELVGSSNPSDLVIKVVVYAQTLTPLSGSFSLLSTKETCMELTLGDYCTPEKTSAMPFNVDAATMAREISLLQGLEGTTVSLGRVVSNWEYEWIVTFPRAFLDMNLLQVNSAAIGGSSVDAVVRRLQKGYGLDGAKVAVEVSSNGQDYSTSGVVYHYTPAPDVFSFEPNHGPLQGGTEILVTGINFQNSSSLRCRFGTRVTAAATFLNSTQFTCVSPSGLEEGDVYMEIANHGLFGDMDDAASTFTKSKRVFTYDRDLEIDSVFPVARSHNRECFGSNHGAGVFTLQVTRNAQDYTDTDVPFIYYAEQGMRSISPTFGPAYTAGTRIDVDGAAFVNSSLLSCRFGYLLTPGVFVSSTKMRCTTPPLPKYSGGLVPAPLPEYRNKYADPNVGSAYLFPDAHYYPQYRTRLVSLEVSNNQQDFSLSGINFLYYEDESVEAIAPARAFDSAEPLAIFAYGRNFINTTALSCRLGLQTFPATFVTPKLLLCEVAHPMMYDDARRGSNKFHELAQPRHALFEVSNNGKDFTSSHVVFEFLGACPTGYWCPKQLQGSNGKIPCPRGTYCPGVANTDFTSCPRGTYQPKTAQAACLRCPIGYHCPHTGTYCLKGVVADEVRIGDYSYPQNCYVCGAGTTPDLTLDAPQGQLHELCPAGKYCVAGTAESQKERYMCPAGYFCPTGTANPLVGEIANDALRRRLSSEASNPFLDVNYTKYVGEGDIRVVSAHDMHCFDGIDDDLLGIFRLRQDVNNAGKRIVVNRAEERNRLCARDHKWRTVELALRRNDCDCIAQTKVVRSVFQLWKCTVDVSTGTPTVYDSTRFGWAEVHNSAIQCTFPGARASKPLDLAPLVDVNGSGISFQTGWTETTVVHSYAELRTLVNAKYAAQVAPVDPFVYDLHHAVELIETFGEETSNIAGFVSGSSEESEEDLLRLDACACSEMFKCPNGTTSAAGADDIYNCIKTGDEVLQRVSPVPLTSARLRNGSEFQDLTGIAGQGLGSIVLEPFEVAVLTINTTQLERNITYGAHFQISVYQDCKPCPPQYKCELDDEPPACSYPDDDNTTATRLRTLPLAEISRSAAASGSNETMNIAGCCSCERQEMPYYFENSVVKDRGFPDNKHGYLQFSIAALEETEITIAVELVHGLYVRDFAQGFTQERFDLTVFTPGRADYSPSTPSTNTFLTVLRQADMNDIMLPLNLPEEYVRVAGTLTYKQQVVSSVLINRMSDIFVGDPELPSKRGYMRNSEQNSIGELVSVTIANVSSNGSTDGDVVVVTPTDYFGLYSVPDPWEATQRSDSWWTQELGGSEFLALPYLPYFSSCRGFDSNIFLSKMLETHPDCILVNYDQTVEVDQYPWRKKLTPNADRCLIEYTAEVAVASSLISSISSAASTLTSSSASTTTATTFETFQRGVSLSCLYEENLEGGAEKLRWYEAPTGTVLFYITRDPTASDAFVAEGDTVTGTGWGRSDTLQSYLGTDALIPVKVGDAGVPLAVPQEVYLNLSYYQVTPGQKRLVEAYVNFGKLCAVTRSAELLAILAKKGISPCTFSKATNQLASKAYTLQVSWEPLNWFELMNLFQFTVDVYLGFFTLVAVASMILGFVIWVINRLFTKMKRPPKFRMKLLLKNVASAPPIGIFMASVPIFAACVLIYTWWHVLSSTTPLTTPSAASFEATAGDWLDQISLDVTRVENYKRGRVGLSLIVIGIYLLMLGSKLLVPETMDSKSEDNAYKEMAVTTPEDPFSVEAEKEEEEENEFWDPRAWKRANFLLTTLCFMASMLVFWEFSYSPSFTANIYGYLVLFKIMRTAMELVLEHFLHEKLLVLPFAVVLSASESMMAMGSADFIGFTLFYFVNLTLVMMEHLYTAPLLRRTRALWPKWRLSLQRRMKKAAAAYARAKGVGRSGVGAKLFIAPILFGFQSFFSEDTRMPALYGVRQTDLLYYALFSVFIIPSNFVLGALQLNTMELAHGWKLYEYSAYQRHRFATRDTRWPLAHSSADESIHPSCQSLDLLCFSSQLYFLLLVYAAGILLSMLGVTVCLRASYSFFGDPITLLIIGVVYYLMRALELSCIRLGDKFKVWKPRKLADGTLDEDLAAKLALGAGRQRELERERLELQALNSERFRHRFLERNRPWVLQHLAELFTPRTLQSIEGPAGDGRPNSEYVRDLYHELVNMGEGRRLGGDRSDISSDGEDDLEKMRRAWSNVPVEGASRDLALYWLARARKRRTFSKLVAGIIAASRQSECGVCGKREDGGYTLHVDLAAEDGAKEHDPRALDRLIDGFESELGAQEMDSDLWKAYFRKHAAFLTLCNVCLTARQQALANRGTNKLVADMRKLRSDEFSSDEGSDEDGGDVPFAPIVVARGSIEGRVLTKWLLAARKRMGGAFPRPEAQEEMERYARKLKRSRRRAGKKDHVDSDEEGRDPSRHWRLELNEVARALAIRWVWEARDLRDAAARKTAAELREKLQALNDQIVEADDWFFGRELREAGLALRDDGAQLAEEQARIDEDLAQKVRATERDVEAFAEEKQSTNTAEERAFRELIAKEREDGKTRVAARELELLEAYKQKETEFASAQRQAREAGELAPALVAEHRTYLAKMAEDRRAELEAVEEAASAKTQQKEDSFARKLALAEAAVSSRRALSQHRILALRKEARGAVRARESAWQSKARSWIDRASRKVQVKQQEDAEAQLNDKRRRKRVLLAT
ncbi:hypothetical protein PRIC2_001345 [Phytophthora ramorum]